MFVVKKEKNAKKKEYDDFLKEKEQIKLQIK